MFQGGEDDTSTPIISNINPVTDPAVNDVLDMLNLKINEKQCKVEDEPITVTYMSAYLQELSASYLAWRSEEVGVPDYAMVQNNLKMELFSWNLVRMHAIHALQCTIRVHERREEFQPDRTCASARRRVKVYYFLCCHAWYTSWMLGAYIYM